VKNRKGDDQQRQDHTGPETAIPSASSTREAIGRRHTAVTTLFMFPLSITVSMRRQKGEAVTDNAALLNAVWELAPGHVSCARRNGCGKVNHRPGEVQCWMNGEVPSTGAVRQPAGGLIFWGDLNQKFQRLTPSPAMLWETTRRAGDGQYHHIAERPAVYFRDRWRQPAVPGTIPNDANPQRWRSHLNACTTPFHLPSGRNASENRGQIPTNGDRHPRVCPRSFSCVRTSPERRRGKRTLPNAVGRR
jgi:hypothetical protein